MRPPDAAAAGCGWLVQSLRPGGGAALSFQVKGGICEVNGDLNVAAADSCALIVDVQINAGDHVLQIQGVSIVDVGDIQRVQVYADTGVRLFGC